MQWQGTIFTTVNEWDLRAKTEPFLKLQLSILFATLIQTQHKEFQSLSQLIRNGT